MKANTQGWIGILASPIVVLALIVIASHALKGVPVGGVPAVDPEKFAEYLDVEVKSVENVISALVTLQLALFIVVGYCLREFGPIRRLTKPLLVGFSGFLVSAVVSMTLAFDARMQILALVGLPDPGLRAVTETLTNQAVFVAVSCGFAFSGCCILLIGALGAAPGTHTPAVHAADFNT